MTLPILWSFRRCPYAMRARLAIASSGKTVALREVVLREKPAGFLETSPSATVPCLDTGLMIIDESYDIMIWALNSADPEHWLAMPDESKALIEKNDGPFKQALDRYKYASRHQDVNSETERAKAALFIGELNGMLSGKDWLFGSAPVLADMAILPFVRQYAHADLAWFNAQPWPFVIRWLDQFKTSERFIGIMQKYPQWHPGNIEITFP